MKADTIPLLVPDLPSADLILPYLRRIDSARVYTNFGPLATELEQRLAIVVSVPAGSSCRIVAVSSCTAGLELCLQCLRLPAGAPVLAPAFTFPATATAIVRARLRPVFCDVDPEAWLLTPAIARGILARNQLAAILPVATFGCPQDADEWDRFTAETGVPVLIDAAGAFGIQGIGLKTSAVFSLHATKSLGAGEGGFVASTDQQLLDSVRSLSNFGFAASGGMLLESGTNGKLSEYHAAVALAAMEQWPRTQNRRRELLSTYRSVLSEKCPSVLLQERPSDGAYSILAVLLPPGLSARVVASQLRADGIETRQWYLPPLNRHPAFSDAMVTGSLAVTEQLAERLLGLPFHTFIGGDDVKRVVTALAKVISCHATASRAER